MRILPKVSKCMCLSKSLSALLCPMSKVREQKERGVTVQGENRCVCVRSPVQYTFLNTFQRHFVLILVDIAHTPLPFPPQRGHFR